MKKMYLTIVIGLLFLSTNQSSAQDFQELDKSPTDIVYLRQNKLSPPLIKVIYGRPQKQSEKVFGDQIPYGKVWRTGDNEATEIRFFSDVKFGDKIVKAGTYVLHAIPGEEEWTIILNKNTDTWGAFFYDESKDVARIKVSAKEARSLDIFSIGFKQKMNTTFMVLAWDTTRVNIPVESYSHILAKL
ncbi:MAG: DUF2911 domain-containing protein [Bacteroidota bacterium]